VKNEIRHTPPSPPGLGIEPKNGFTSDLGDNPLKFTVRGNALHGQKKYLSTHRK
jgi:hypothetical protein